MLPFFRLFLVAFCALSLLAQTRLLLNLPLTLGWIDGFVFGGTVFGYHCTHPDKRYRILAWIMGIFGGTCFLIPIFASSNVMKLQLIGLAPVVFWLAYYGFQRPGNAGLRSQPFAKPMTVAFTWAWVTVLLPTAPGQWPTLIYLLFGRAAFIFALALAYDLIDSDYDHRRGLKTLTRKLGLQKSFGLIYISLAVSGLFICANVYWSVYDFTKAAGLIFSLIFSALWLRFLIRKAAWQAWQKPLIDGLMILQFVLVFVFSYHL